MCTYETTQELPIRWQLQIACATATLLNNGSIFCNSCSITHVWRQPYKLRLYSEMRRLHDTFHISLLHRYTGDPRRAPKPGPLFIDEEEEYEVESIIADRRHKGELQFLVRLRGWDSDYDTWEPLNHVKDIIALDKYKEHQYPPRKRKRGRPRKSTSYAES